MTSPGIVSVIDSATNTVTATVPVGGSACQLAVDPTTNKIYVTNKGEQFVTVIDGVTNNTTICFETCCTVTNSTACAYVEF